MIKTVKVTLNKAHKIQTILKKHMQQISAKITTDVPVNYYSSYDELLNTIPYNPLSEIMELLSCINKNSAAIIEANVVSGLNKELSKQKEINTLLALFSKRYIPTQTQILDINEFTEDLFFRIQEKTQPGVPITITVNYALNKDVMALQNTLTRDRIRVEERIGELNHTTLVEIDIPEEFEALI